MFTIKTYSILFCTLILSVSFPVSVLAQENTGTPVDLSIDIDGFPPQPTQSTFPEEAVSATHQAESPRAPTATTTTEPQLRVGTIPEAPSKALVPAAPTSETTAAVADNQDVLPKPVPHSGLYYDADSLVPSSALGTSVGPRNVDPKYEPGSSYVVVRKGAGAHTRQAKMVAAQRALKLGRYTSALELYEQLYKKAPRNTQILMGLAVSQQESGFVESSIATYEELLKVDPKNTNATVNMLGLVKQRYPSVAYRKLKDLWQRNSQSPAIAAQLGLTSASAGNPQDALRYLGIAASMEPQNASHFYNMAVVSDQAGAYKDAVDLYQKALEVDISYGNGRSIPREQVYDRLAKLRRL